MKESTSTWYGPWKSWIRPFESAIPMWPTQGQQQVRGPSGPHTTA
eukprot:CAMPEP_0182810194 /NCGR_PEP_ID=MMETSP0006_2-20121128/7598_1 /TAXON_ID=97485 /ORGANISM="Prymnesium parvum, Strain Texoma1" /LENGTH=44 /DNA_ID= /DNA_START= /DNA_END= /DNA_ORIENTATION=